MKRKPNYITLEIINNLDKNAQVVVLGGNFNPNTQANATTYQQFDLTAETFAGVTNLSLEYNIAGNPTAFYKTSNIYQLSVPGVAAILNTFNLGFWFASGNIVYTYNDDYLFKTLTIS